MPQPSRFNNPNLLDRLRNRDPQVWEALYEEQWDPLCRFIRVHLPDGANDGVDSEDLAQEVFCRAYTGISHFRGEACLETCLKSIAQHVIIDMVRMASLRHRLGKESDMPDRVRDAVHCRSAPAPEMSAVRKDVLGKVLREIETVLGKYSGIFVKRYLQDLSEQEVAQAEGLKRGTASGYLSRARDRVNQQRARFTSFL
jgi:RNA polymerase sigma factor (sigma-70 family)